MSEAAATELPEEPEVAIPSDDLNLDSLDGLSGGGVTVTADSAKAHGQAFG